MWAKSGTRAQVFTEGWGELGRYYRLYIKLFKRGKEAYSKDTPIARPWVKVGVDKQISDQGTKTHQ